MTTIDDLAQTVAAKYQIPTDAARSVRSVWR